VAAATVTTGKLQVAISRMRVWWSEFESRQGQKISLLSKTSRPALGPTRTLLKEYCWLFKAVGMWGWPLTLHLAPRLRMNGAAPPLPICLYGANRDSFTSTSFKMFNGVASRVEKRTTSFGIRSFIAQK
jgi:hypothetical protein